MPDYKLTTRVTSDEKDTVTVERMVRAKNEARAIAHVVKDTVTCERLQIDDAIRLGTQGVEIEIASDAA